MAHKLDQTELTAMRSRIMATLKACQGNMRRTAMLLGVQLRTLYFRMDRLKEEGLGLDPNDFRPASYRHEKISQSASDVLAEKEQEEQQLRKAPAKRS